MFQHDRCEHHRGLRQVRFLGSTLLLSASLVVFSVPPSMAGEICSAEITSTLKAQLSRAIRDRREERVRLNCHDFKIRANLTFNLSEGAYELSGTLIHVKSVDFDDKWNYGITISEDGRKWHLGGIGDYSLQGRPNPLQGNWEREGKRLINEVGRIAAERIRKHVASCEADGGTSTVRDHRVKRRDHRTSCRLDVPTTGTKKGPTRRPN